MKKDKRININDKRGTTYLFLISCCLISYFYVIFFVFYDQLSFKTGFCDSCSGPFRLINNPIPFLLWGFLAIITCFIFPKIFRDDYIDFAEKGKTIREITHDNGDIYYGQVKDTSDGYTIANGRGILRRKNGEEVKGVWKNGKLQ
jgi:hypothetical protein